MQQFQVPQYIEIEDKIFGNVLTLKQFMFAIGGVAFIVVLWFANLPGFVFWPLAMIIGSFFGSLAFLKINGQPFVTVMGNALSHWFSARRYVWKHQMKPLVVKKVVPQKKEMTMQPPRLSQSKLKELAWSLDINDKLKR